MPPYWINMGAVAISTLAGALLVQHASEAPFLTGMLPFLKSFTVFFWATATWWILEEVGAKGMRVGGIPIAPLHANLFINKGEATARDIRKLARILKRRVKKRFRIRLERNLRLQKRPKMLDTKPPWENESTTDWRITLLRSEEIARTTMAFHFMKPTSLEFMAGQFVDLTLVSPPEMDDQGPSRTLTIASAPFEDELMFAVRIRDSAFKRDLKGAAPWMPSPDGSSYRQLHSPSQSDEDQRVHSRRYRHSSVSEHRSPNHSRGYSTENLSLYSNRRPEDAPFRAELQALAGDNPQFQFIPTVTQVSTSPHP